jgi:hypothetical protein
MFFNSGHRFFEGLAPCCCTVPTEPELVPQAPPAGGEHFVDLSYAVGLYVFVCACARIARARVMCKAHASPSKVFCRQNRGFDSKKGAVVGLYCPPECLTLDM